MSEQVVTPHEGEAHHEGVASKLNWLRAGVLGANDGIVSVAGIVVGVAGASSQHSDIAVVGVAGVAAAALSPDPPSLISAVGVAQDEGAPLSRQDVDYDVNFAHPKRGTSSVGSPLTRSDLFSITRTSCGAPGWRPCCDWSTPLSSTNGATHHRLKALTVLAPHARGEGRLDRGWGARWR